MADFVIGVDLGQAQDYTAITVLEVRPKSTGRRWTQEVLVSTLSGSGSRGYVVEEHAVLENDYAARHLERLPLGTSYAKQVARVKGIVTRLKAEGHGTDLVVDQSGVGRAVVDMFRAAELKPMAITITGGDSVTRDGQDYRVPKRDLVSVIQVLLQGERLKIAKELPEAQTLISELLAFKVSISLRGHDSYGNDVGAWREAPHDDLVLAVALACWWGENRPPPPPTAADTLMTMQVMTRMKEREW